MSAEKKGVSLKQTIFFSLGSMGREVSNNCVSVFLLAYLNVVMGLDSLVLAIMFFFVKIVESLLDPISAAIVNNSKPTKFGRFRTWVGIGTLLNAVVLIVLFLPVNQVGLFKGNISTTGMYVYYLFMYLLWGVTYTLIDAPYWSMIPTIADTTSDRNNITSISRLIGGFGSFVTSTLATAFVFKVFAPKLGSAMSYWLLGIFGAVLMIIFISFTVFGNKEKYQLPQQNVSYREIIDLLKNNEQLRAYAVSFLLFIMASQVAIAQIIYLFIYYGDSGLGLLRQDQYGLFIGLACTGQGVAMIFYNLLTKKLPREKIYGLNYFMGIFGMLAMYCIFFVLGKNIWVNVILVSIAGAMLMTSSGLNQIGSTVMLSDIADYNEYKNGKRSDSVIFSIQTIMTKFAVAFALLVTGIGVKVAKLPPITETVTESGEFIQTFVNTATNQVTFSAMNILRLFMFILPIPLMIAGYIVYKKKYTLVGEKYDKVKAAIEERRAGKPAEESTAADETPAA